MTDCVFCPRLQLENAILVISDGTSPVIDWCFDWLIDWLTDSLPDWLSCRCRRKSEHQWYSAQDLWSPECCASFCCDCHNDSCMTVINLAYSDCYTCRTHVHRVPKKWYTKLILITLSILNTDFHNSFTGTLSGKFAIKQSSKISPHPKDFTTPKTCRCTTLWNINFQKLLEPKHGNRKLIAHELKKMWAW